MVTDDPIVGERSETVDRTFEVFFSYSHKDEKMREKLEKHLSALRRENVIAAWHDRKIMPGTAWRDQLDEHIKTADIILLLISAEFLNSDYCYDIELKLAMARHEAGEARVVPIILRPCDWSTTPFAKLQALPRSGKPVTDFTTQDHAFEEVARGLRRIVEDISRRQSQVKPLAPLGTPTFGRIAIPEAIEKKLARMKFINASIQSDEEVLDDNNLMTEYTATLAEMVETFLPLVEQLVSAGLVTVNINIEHIDDLAQYSTLTGEPTIAFDNGNIWLDTEYAGGTLRKKKA